MQRLRESAASAPCLTQINGQRLQALGFGEVSPEAPANRKKGQTYTRAGMRDLMAKVRAAAAAPTD